MKSLTLILLALISIPAISQTQELRQFGIIEVFRGGDSLFIKKLTTRVIKVSEGMITKSRTPPDSAILYLSSDNAVYEGTTVWRKVGGGAVVPVLKEAINDVSTRIAYTGTWAKWANQSWTNGSCTGCKTFLNADVSVASTVNASASVTFTGRQVAVTAEFRENHGVAKIEVKQGATVIDTKTVDMYKATTVNAPTIIYDSGFLPQGTYTVTISLSSITTGRDSMVLDSFLVFE